MYKQVIIVRKDLQMSGGKQAAQVAHASGAFLAQLIVDAVGESAPCVDASGQEYFETVPIRIPAQMYREWFDGSFAKVVLQAKNHHQLLRAVEMAREAGMVEDRDYFLIFDECRTELTPEEEDGSTLTCVGFRPMPAEEIDPIGRKFHLYQD